MLFRLFLSFRKGKFWTFSIKLWLMVFNNFIKCWRYTEVNLNGKTGFISNIGDTDSMINNAMSLLSNPQKHKLFKKQAQLQAKNSIQNLLLIHTKES